MKKYLIIISLIQFLLSQNYSNDYDLDKLELIHLNNSNPFDIEFNDENFNPEDWTNLRNEIQRNGNLIEQISQNWDHESNIFFNSWKSIFSYDEYNNRIHWFRYNWNETIHLWVPTDAWEYTYDSNNNELEYINLDYIEGIWVNDFKKISYYNDENLRISFFNFDWLGYWHNYSYYIYEYDEDNNKISDSRYEDHYANGSFIIDYHCNYTFDNENNLITKEESQSYNNDGILTIYYVRNYSYNDNNLMIEEFIQSLFSGTESKYIYEYDENNNVIYRYYFSNADDDDDGEPDGDWYNGSMNDYIYDENNNEIETTYYYWLASWNQYENEWFATSNKITMYDSNNNKVEEISSGRGLGSEWVPSWKYIYYYDYNFGCLDPEACNYNINAIIDDGNCQYDLDSFCDCDGNFLEDYCDCNGNLLDICGSCGGNDYDDCDDDEDGLSNLEQWGYGAHSIDVIDVPNDQGGRVYVSFKKSFYDDTDPIRDNEIYHIQRSDDIGWVFVGSASAIAEDEYIVEVTTLSDSTAQFNGISEYRVIATMDEGTYISYETGSGYSVDNISPEAPQQLFGINNNGQTQLSWLESSANDLDYYKVYRDNEMIGMTENASFSESGLPYLSSFDYSIRAVDTNGNESEFSESLAISHTTEISIPLNEGANLISFYALPDDKSVGNVLSDIQNNATGIIGEGVAASQISPGVWVGSLNYIEPTGGYWLKMSSEDNLDLSGTYVGYDLEYTLDAGANLISFPHPVPTEIGEALPGYVEEFFSGFIGEGVAATQITLYNWVGSLSHLEGGEGYWVNLHQPVTFSFAAPGDIIILNPATPLKNLKK